ncbi:MAG: hypothetical protein QW598_01465 [Pyrobaculum sp.]
MGLRDRYSARKRNLHELVFYEGIIDMEDVKIELEKTRKYVEVVEILLRETKRQQSNALVGAGSQVPER